MAAGKGRLALLGRRLQPGRQGAVTLVVDDLDDRLAEFEDRGISVGSIDTAAGVVRKAVIIAMRFQRGGLVANRATPPG